ncbi:prolyl oligopeptidase family serine peptidase [uncultured Prevotella sp.]|uniref:alpha/beta hydrolase family esterase n=1 Tax=uncultured Prevotella sp. TaxID=159272 RepID=UPI0025D558A8|nr:prolyl oligopeptidase family serine peptidase [uncultured Prevotella sp.]
MKKLLLCMFTLVLLASTKLMAAKENKFYNITVDGKARKYLLYVPNKVKENAPVVFSLHGAGGVVSTSSHDPNFNPIADKDSFIVVYPQGLDTVFPGLGGMTAPGWSAYGEENFDTHFLLAVLEKIAEKYTIDRQRIYCCGFSNGGMMTYTMANTNSHIFAAFAAISGYPINEFHLHHTSWRPVPFLHIHGKSDDFVKYSLVPNIIDNMVARNGANPVPQVTTQSGSYKKSIYEAGEGGFPVIFYEIDGMGHEAFTNKTEDSSSSQTMWNFFKQYTLDSPCDTTLKWRPRIETEGYEPIKHGWTMNNSTTLLRFGGTQKTNDNQNVYRSLQFETGGYTLHFKAEGDASKQIKVQIQKLTSPRTMVLNTQVNVGGEINLPFVVEDGWGEYKLTITRFATTDEITISDIQIHSSNDAVTAIKNVSPAVKQGRNTYLSDLQGRILKHQPRKGIVVKDGKKITSRH